MKLQEAIEQARAGRTVRSANGGTAAWNGNYLVFSWGECVKVTDETIDGWEVVEEWVTCNEAKAFSKMDEGAEVQTRSNDTEGWSHCTTGAHGYVSISCPGGHLFSKVSRTREWRHRK